MEGPAGTRAPHQAKESEMLTQREALTGADLATASLGGELANKQQDV